MKPVFLKLRDRVYEVPKADPDLARRILLEAERISSIYPAPNPIPMREIFPMVPLVWEALWRKYPELTCEDVEEMVTFVNMPAVVEALVGFWERDFWGDA